MMDPMTRPKARHTTRPTDTEVEDSFRNRYAILFPHLVDHQIRLVLAADANSLTEQGRDGAGIAELEAHNTPTN